MAEAPPDGYANELRREIMRSEVQRVRMLAIVLAALLACTLIAVNFFPEFTLRMFRGGFARTIPGARQMVAHGHILVNGKKVDRASYRVTRGDTISVREGSKALATRGLESGGGLESPWLFIDKAALTIQISSYPDETFTPFELEPRLIVEHYSRAM